MKLFNNLFIIVLTVSSQAFASLPRSAVTSVTATVHGFYTTSDPTCMTDLKAAIKVQSTGMSVDMTQSPKLGQGEVTNPIRCVVMLLKNTINFTWAAGDYSSTSTQVTINNVSTAVNDAVCNAGATQVLNICRSTTNAVPAKIQADALEAGVTIAATCPAVATGTEIVPLFISTNSACTGDTTTDAVNCPNGTLNTFTNPTGALSRNGIKLEEPESAPSYRFNMDFHKSVGANSATTCDSGAPKFSFIPDSE